MSHIKERMADLFRYLCGRDVLSFCGGLAVFFGESWGGWDTLSRCWSLKDWRGVGRRRWAASWELPGGITGGCLLCWAFFSAAAWSAAFCSAFCLRRISFASLCSFSRSSNGLRLPGTFLLSDKACVYNRKKNKTQKLSKFLYGG